MPPNSISADSSDRSDRRSRSRLRTWWAGNGVFVKLFTCLVLLAIVYLAPNILVFIEAGHAGVLYRRLGGGTDTNRVFAEGLHVKFPWNIMTIYDERYQQLPHTFSVISSNGLTVSLTVSVRYRPKFETLGILHKEVGTNYANVIIIPEVQALIRRVVGQFTPSEIYTTKRSMLQNILEGSAGQIAQLYLVLDDVLIKKIELPAAVEEAIETKLTEEQRFLEMQFRLDREMQEADRRRIKGHGISNYQNTISGSLSDHVLEFEGIQATLDLARSPNPKLVVIGTHANTLIGLSSAFGAEALNTPASLAKPTLPGATNRLSPDVAAEENDRSWP